MTGSGVFKISRDRWYSLISAQAFAVAVILLCFVAPLELFNIRDEILHFAIAGLVALLAIVTCFFLAVAEGKRTGVIAFATAAIAVLAFMFSVPFNFSQDIIVGAVSSAMMVLMGFVLLLFVIHQPHWSIRILVVVEAAVIFLGLRLILNLTAD